MNTVYQLGSNGEICSIVLYRFRSNLIVYTTCHAVYLKAKVHVAGRKPIKAGSIINFLKDNCFVPLRLSNRRE